MTLLVLLSISIVVAAAVYLSLSRDLFRVVIGLTMLGAATNLIVFAAGRFATLTPPLLATVEDAQAAAVANPLVQALVLTMRRQNMIPLALSSGWQGIMALLTSTMGRMQLRLMMRVMST